MSKQITDSYLITTLTNLHAGSGDTTYGIVDNQIQRDPIDDIPVIHASSLKGALRQRFADLNCASLDSLFGSDNSSRNKVKNNFRAGNHLFFEAKLLVLPVRSNVRPFFRAVSQEVLQSIRGNWEVFDFTPDSHLQSAFDFIKNLDPPSPGMATVFNQKSSVLIEDLEKPAQNQKAENGGWQNATSIFGENLTVLHHDDFKRLCKKLPVIARNKLENGLSENLFYEEVVPRQSSFYTFLLRPENDSAFEQTLAKGKHRVQVGGSATLGYGQCKFQLFPSTQNHTA